MKIIIIDHQSNGKTFRGELIKSQIDAQLNNLQTFFIPFIYGEKEINNPPSWDISMFDRIGFADVYLIHTSNLLAIELIEYIIFKHPNSYIIEYSGGGSEYMTNRKSNSQKHCIYPKSVNNQGAFPNLIVFISALLNNKNKPFDILLGKNKKLELALKYLHERLGGKPDKEEIVTDGEEKFDLMKVYKGQQLKKWIEELDGKTGSEYNKALAIVRDALLEQAGVTGEN